VLTVVSARFLFAGQPQGNVDIFRLGIIVNGLDRFDAEDVVAAVDDALLLIKNVLPSGLARATKTVPIFVREITKPETRELYDLRASLAEMTGRQLAIRMTKGELAELEEWLVRLQNAAARRDMAHYFRLNIGFHDRMVEMTCNTTLLEFDRVVIGRMHLMRRRNFSVSIGG
jgi:hypothetical protein